MCLKKVTNQNLDSNLKLLVTNEREILSEILIHIAEVERRKLYLTYGYCSLFEYLTKRIGYANGSAQRRIDAARLSFDAPDVIEKLESGELNLAQVSLLQKSIREVQASSKTKIEPQVKEDLVEKLSNKSFTESEVLVSQALNIKPKEYTKTMHQKDESIRLEITFTKVQWAKLVKMRELLSNSLPYGNSWDQVLEYVSESVIQKKDKSQVVTKKSTVDREKVNKESNSSSFKPEYPVKVARKVIPRVVQRKIFQRDQCCQYKDKNTGKQCESKWRLTIDHIRPVWAGGGNTSENLRVLCANHNREIYRQQAYLSQI
ncbi:MAG: hypothetical protein B7Y39_16035 [Bdellovibrio sp. 28-41-41]|nr:MAG: hypothetical protein B7Y39_16035 [Bdellovibrio sp. 28-41-41]